MANGSSKQNRITAHIGLLNRNKVVRDIVLSLILLAWHTVSLAAPPGKSTAVSPVGSLTDATPTFVFTQVRGVESYKLLLRTTTGQVYQKWYKVTANRCRNGLCRLSPGIEITAKTRWSIRTRNSDGQGPWSNGLWITANSGPVPARPTLLSPSDSQSAREIEYRWLVDYDATRYQFMFRNVDGTRERYMYSASAICLIDECTIRRNDTLQFGVVKWWVRGINENGVGRWSRPMTYTRLDGRPAQITRVVSPARGTDVPPGPITYRWAAVNNADRYQVSIRDETGALYKSWYDSRDVSCTSAGATCGITRNDRLHSGTIRFLVRAYNRSHGAGRWSKTHQFILLPESNDRCAPGGNPLTLTYLSAKYKAVAAKQAALTPQGTNPCATTAYYRHIDPDNARNTLDRWLRVNGFLVSGAPEVVDQIDRRFLASDVVNAEYQNMIDLGFGRDMYCKRDGEKPDTFPCIVQNFLVTPDLTRDALSPASYQVSVAMEFLKSCEDGAFSSVICGATGFYVYDKKGRRLNSVDLDGNGDKRVPQVCLACHGGEYADDGVLVTKLERGEYLPFSEKLFAHFERDSDAVFDTYDASLKSVGIYSPDSRAINKLLRPVLGYHAIDSFSGELRDFSIGYFTDSGAPVTSHSLDSHQAKVKNTFCVVCHTAVEGDYALTDPIRGGSNCRLCHDNRLGGGSKERLKGHLCSGNSDLVMPNARVTHKALYSAAKGIAPYDEFEIEAKAFVDSVCGPAGMSAPR